MNDHQIMRPTAFINHAISDSEFAPVESRQMKDNIELMKAGIKEQVRVEGPKREKNNKWDVSRIISQITMTISL